MVTTTHDALDDIRAFAPIIGGALGAFIGFLGALFIAHNITKGIKGKDITFDFSNRYHDIIGNAHKVETPEDARRWWIRYFDLQMFQYLFYVRGLFIKDVFIEWMKWRNQDFQRGSQVLPTIKDIDYKAGWEIWRNSSPSGADSPFRDFLDRIHSAPDPDAVAVIVREEADLRLKELRRRQPWFDGMIGVTPP